MNLMWTVSYKPGSTVLYIVIYVILAHQYKYSYIKPFQYISSYHLAMVIGVVSSKQLKFKLTTNDRIIEKKWKALNNEFIRRKNSPIVNMV